MNSARGRCVARWRSGGGLPTISRPAGAAGLGHGLRKSWAVAPHCCSRGRTEEAIFQSECKLAVQVRCTWKL